MFIQGKLTNKGFFASKIDTASMEKGFNFMQREFRVKFMRGGKDTSEPFIKEKDFIIWYNKYEEEALFNMFKEQINEAVSLSFILQDIGNVELREGLTYE